MTCETLVWVNKRTMRNQFCHKPARCRAVRTIASILLFFGSLFTVPEIKAQSSAIVSAANTSATKLHTLTTIRAVHYLSQVEARRRYPVHVVGVVTYFDPYLNYPRRPIVMVTDSTGTIYVALPGLTTLPLRAGALVDVSGKSGPGDFAPTIDEANVRILGHVSLPKHPSRESLPHLLTGSEDAKWVELEGIVESIEVVGMNVTLKLALRDGEIAATTVLERGADYKRLVDAKVLIAGVAGSLFNRQSQIIGNQLLFPNLSTVTLEEPAPADPFRVRVSAIDELMTYNPGKSAFHRVHIRGVVTLSWPGRLLCVENAGTALCAEVSQTAAVEAGRIMDVVGFPQIGNVTPTLRDAIFRPAQESRAVDPKPFDADQLLGEDLNSHLVQVDGTVIAHERTAQDPTVVIASGKRTFPVVLPRSAEAAKLIGLKEGSRVRLTGIVSIQADSRVFTRHDGYPVAMYFQFMLRSSEDIRVLSAPSWWSVEHTLRVLAATLVLTLLTLGWVTLLSRRVRGQARQLHHQATRDALTGVWNRKAALDLLTQERTTSLETSKPIGVLMLDADHFKDINDTHGHLAGDAVLQELASRIEGAIRLCDRVGRFGGEEFLIVLRECDGDGVLVWGEKIRSVIADQPMHAGGCLLPVTVSIGATVLEPHRDTTLNALAAADGALYQAKHEGRNRVISTESRLIVPKLDPSSEQLSF